MNKVLTDYYIAREAHDEAHGTLEEKVRHIITVMTKFFKVRGYWWAFDYYHNADDSAPLPRRVENGIFPIYIAPDRGEGCVTDAFDYNNGIPVEFFDMTDEQIVAYLKKEVAECEAKAKIEAEKEEARKAKSKVKKDEVAKIAVAALAKLTPEERKALKVR